MKQLVVLSGKGGTGKTAVTAALAHLSSLEEELPGVFVDADVDAANLDLLIGASQAEPHPFSGGETAQINSGACMVCGICEDVCRFDAVTFNEGTGQFEIDPLACEGCAACHYQCPEGAIAMVPSLAGQWFRSESRFGPLFHARLRPAQENSGKLVALIKEEAASTASEAGYPFTIVDGPPGIACPAIAAITGAQWVLIVAEPTVAGIHDLERALGMVGHFSIDVLVCINKADLYPEGVRMIQERCRDAGVRVLGTIPFDETVTQSLLEGRPITEFRPDASASLALKELWRKIRNLLTNQRRSVQLPVL